MDINTALESFPDIAETTRTLLEHETRDAVILWATEYYSHKYHTKLNDVVIAIVNHLARG